MTTGRWLMLACGLLLVAGCVIQPAGRRTQSAYVQREVSPAFSTVAGADQLGPDWQDEGCWQPIGYVYATPDADRVLLRRYGSSPLWIENGRVRELPQKPGIGYVDAAMGLAYTVERADPGENDQLLVRELPKGKWRDLPVDDDPGWPAGPIIGLSGHDAASGLWITHWPPGGYGGLTATIGTISADEDYTPIADLIRTSSAQRGIFARALAGDAALAVAGDAIWFIDPELNAAEGIYDLPPDRTCRLIPDSTDPDVGWLLVEPQLSATGTGKAGAAGESGYVVALNTHGAELARLSTGSVKFVRLSGDWQNRRALLLHPSIGVALANAQTGELSWLLRQSGAAQLQLLPGGQVWAFVPDGIIGIEGDDLIRLAPKLAAGEVLTRDQLALIKPVAEALRWRWDDVQLSPLVHEAGRLTFFNTGEVDADWAEFDWHLSRELVSRLLIARRPEAADLKLPGLSDAQLDEQVLAMLTVLGWPAAARDPGRGTRGAEELNAFYRLSPEAAADDEAGEFQLWITSGATMLRLTAEDGSTAQEIPPDDAGGESAR